MAIMEVPVISVDIRRYKAAEGEAIVVYDVDTKRGYRATIGYAVCPPTLTMLAGDKKDIDAEIGRLKLDTNTTEVTAIG